MTETVAGESSSVPGSTRRRKKAAPGSGLSLNLTAMIDVVFLLLIYFMVGTEFRLGEQVYRMDLPQRQAAAASDPFDLPDEPLRIHVTSTGDGVEDFALSLEGPYPQPNTIEGLFEFLRNRRMTPGVAGGLFEADHPIIIIPEQTTRWDHTIAVYNTAARARYSNITLAEVEGSGQSQ